MKEPEKKRVFNLFHHDLVPEHQLLSKKEVEDLVQEYHIRPHQLPYIKASDPCVQQVNGKPGDVVRVLRKSATAGEAVVYRYVIEN